MDSKDQQQEQDASGVKNINIDINGDPDEGIVKSMSSDERVGLSKEELMKFVNQPFWVRLRNILFASFWIIWVSILIAAIGYVARSPGCTMAMADNSATTTTAATTSPSG